MSTTKKALNKDLKFNKNEDAMKLLLSNLNRKMDEVSLGGGKAKIEKHHSKGKMTARERVAFFIR
jgi:acetyl-CoA carboxylase carboxyltransferase component